MMSVSVWYSADTEYTKVAKCVTCTYKYIVGQWEQLEFVILYGLLCYNVSYFATDCEGTNECYSNKAWLQKILDITQGMICLVI